MDGNDNVIITGSFPFGRSIYTAKYAAADGTLLWEKHYDGLATRSFGKAIAIDSGGNVIVLGDSDHTNDSGNVDFYTAKYAASDGALLWEKRYNGPADRDDFSQTVQVDGNGNVVVTGNSTRADSYSTDWYTAKYAAADGALLWERRLHDQGEVEAMALDATGNVVLTGTVLGSAYTAKYGAADGEVIWEKYSGTVGAGLAVDGSGNVAVSGVSYNGTNADIYTAKYAAADGKVLWEKHSNNGWGRVESVAVDSSGNVVVAGTFSVQLNINSYYTAKYAALDGSLLWERRFQSNDGRSTWTTRYGLALGRGGRVALTGTIGTGDDMDFATVVYAETLPLISAQKIAASILLRFPGVAGHSYQVESAPTPTGPWSIKATLTALTSGPLEYLHTNAVPSSAFYRTSTGL